MGRVAQPGPAQRHKDNIGSSLPHKGEQQTNRENRQGNKHISKERFLANPTLPLSVRPSKEINPFVGNIWLKTFESFMKIVVNNKNAGLVCFVRAVYC